MLTYSYRLEELCAKVVFIVGGARLAIPRHRNLARGLLLDRGLARPDRAIQYAPLVPTRLLKELADADLCALLLRDRTGPNHELLANGPLLLQAEVAHQVVIIAAV